MNIKKNCCRCINHKSFKSEKKTHVGTNYRVCVCGCVGVCVGGGCVCVCYHEADMLKSLELTPQ